MAIVGQPNNFFFLALWSVEINFKLMETVKKRLEIANQVKKRRFYVINDLRTRKMRARAFTREIF